MRQENLEEPTVKRIIPLVLILFIFAAMVVSAEESRMFVKTMPITKIYLHRLGFKVVYYKSDLTFGEFYVPMKWFDEAGGKGVLTMTMDQAAPFFSIFWFDGEFHSVKLYVKSDLKDITWGDIPTDSGIDDRFDIEALEIDF